MSIKIELPNEMKKNFDLIKNQITQALQELYPDMNNTSYSGDTIFIRKWINPELKTIYTNEEKDRLCLQGCSYCGSHDLEFTEFPVEEQQSPIVKCKKCGNSGV